MGGRLIEAVTGIGVLASGAILVVMLAAPWLSPDGELAGTEVEPSVTASAAVGSASPGSALPPLGSFQLGSPLDFGRVCLGVELAARAYPVAAGATGLATVYWWESAIVDPGHPEACHGRASDLRAEEAVVEPIPDDDEPDGPPLGYSLLFHLPGPTGAERDMEIALLTEQSTPDRLQALDLTTSGSGLVFERVSAIDPQFVPPPSLAAGLFLSRGPLGVDLPCLVLDMTGPAPAVGDAEAVPFRWWETGMPEPGDAAACLGRTSEVGEGQAIITAFEIVPGVSFAGYSIAFELPARGDASPRPLSFEVPIDQRSPDQLAGILTDGDTREPIVFDRVDTIDPPLVPAP